MVGKIAELWLNIAALTSRKNYQNNQNRCDMNRQDNIYNIYSIAWTNERTGETKGARLNGRNSIVALVKLYLKSHALALQLHPSCCICFVFVWFLSIKTIVFTVYEHEYNAQYCVKIELDKAYNAAPLAHDGV